MALRYYAGPVPVTNDLQQLERFLRDEFPRIQQAQLDSPMNWAGYYDGGCYQAGDVLLDEGWLAIANKNTCDRPAPQPSGPERSEWEQDPAAPFITVSETDENVVITGHRYTDTVDVSGWVREIWFYATEASPDIFYDFFLVVDPLSENPVSRSLGEFEFDRVGWQLISVGDLLLVPGEQFDLVAAIKFQGEAGSSTFTHTWQYKQQNGSPDPTSGEVWHESSGQTMRFSRDDKNGNNRGADLDQVKAGDRISVGGAEYSVTEVVGTGGVYEFDVTPRSRVSDNEYNIQFTIFAAGTIPHPQITDHYSGDTPKGFKVTGTGTYPANVVEDNNSYGFDVVFQPASVSDDWDIMAASSAAGAGGDPGGGAVLPPGTVEGSVLRYSGAEWEESSAVNIDSAGNFGVGAVAPVFAGYTAIAASNPTSGGLLESNDGVQFLRVQVNSAIEFAAINSSKSLEINAFGGPSLVFKTNNVERGRFVSTGNFLIGKDSTATSEVGVDLNPTGTIRSTKASVNPLVLRADGLTTGAKTFVRFERDAVAKGGINVQSGTGAPTFYGSSDRRLKTDVRDLSPAAALNLVSDLRPRRYKSRQTGEVETGFIAQEVEAVPQLAHLVFNAEYNVVDEDGNETTVTDRFKSLAALRDVDALLVAAIHELIDRVAVLEARQE